MEDEKRCPHCNAPLDGLEEVCPNCGREIPSAEWLNARPKKAVKMVNLCLFWVSVAAAVLFLLVLGEPVSGCGMAVVAAIIFPSTREAYRGNKQQRAPKNAGTGNGVVLVVAVVVICFALIGYSSREEDTETQQSGGPEEGAESSADTTDDAVPQGESDEIAPDNTTEDAEGEEFVIPEPIIYSGSGDDVVDLDIPDDFGEYVFQIAGNEEARLFAVVSYNSTGEYSELLVNTTDPYEGVTMDASQDVARLEVKATGEWSISVTSLYSMPMVGLDEVHNGTGDAVFLNAGGAGDGTAYISGNEESRHFAVTAYVLDGDNLERELWINTTDAYEGTVMTGGTPIIIVVDASDTWEITLNG